MIIIKSPVPVWCDKCPNTVCSVCRILTWCQPGTERNCAPVKLSSLVTTIFIHPVLCVAAKCRMDFQWPVCPHCGVGSQPCQRGILVLSLSLSLAPDPWHYDTETWHFLTLTQMDECMSKQSCAGVFIVFWFSAPPLLCVDKDNIENDDTWPWLIKICAVFTCYTIHCDVITSLSSIQYTGYRTTGVLYCKIALMF